MGAEHSCISSALGSIDMIDALAAARARYRSLM
jgi:hypothetical protein